MHLPRTPSFRLDGKRALVTGASRGIGLGCAVALAEAGAHVVCAARGKTALNETVKQLHAEDWSAEALVMDVADLAGMTNALKTQAAFDIVVNSAGIARHAPALETAPEDYDAVMDVNLRGAYFLSVEAARGMQRENKPGSIIQISSQMGHVGGIDRSVYCASKHAIEGMVKAMAIEWGPKKIRINSICPTFIRTPFTEATFADPERVAWIESKIKLGRVGEVEDVMGAVVYLASDASAMVTGSSLLIDGGWTAG
ncbi:SDR family NAD(P)-dependent oxidoreductase [Pelagibius sp. Alg239-R121]|uniref:SDR family NAD(P)-dependent oxidoreductase n=1 Tax=Pelagibius sp. Alg239-R121 TaxID=2993448 RepID=UPI0024A7967D|nr:SDR family oxidoreductase [Pelagibius sp. Alg239-R121]